VSTQAPLGESQESGAAQVMPPHCAQPARQMPSTQVCPDGQLTFAQGSTQAPWLHSLPCGQVMPSQGPTQLPPRHNFPSGQPTPAHLGSRHSPEAASQASGDKQENSTELAQ